MENRTRLSCAIQAHSAAVGALWKNAFLDDESWNVAPADIPHKTPLPAGSPVAGPRRNWSLIPSGLVTADIEAGSFGSLLKSRRNSDRAGLIAAAEERLATLGLRQSHLQVVESKSALGAQLAPEDIAGILARPRLTGTRQAI